MSGKPAITNKVRVIASSETWMEGETIRQLEATADRPGMLRCVAFPDAQPGKGSPSGAAFLSDLVYPTLVGTDIGCGIALWVTTLVAKKVKPDKIAIKLNGLDQPWEGDLKKWMEDRGVAPSPYDMSLGTCGKGNHFIELQAIDQIFDRPLFDALGMDQDSLHLMVHSGSRGFGESVLVRYAAQNGATGVAADTPIGQQYMEQNAQAMAWAVANRELCALRALQAIGADGKRLLDICHNSVSEVSEHGCRCWLHRKGSAPADEGAIVIPGSRGDLSYVVNPILGNDAALRSLAHGAGRKISRGEARGKLESLYYGKDVRKNRFGGKLVCGDRTLLLEEAPECYKSIDTVINHLVDTGLIQVIAALRPMATFKTSESTEETLRRDRKGWQRERDAARQAKRHR